MKNRDEIIKTKACLKTDKWHRAFGAREMAQKIWGDLKVSDSFLYLYRCFGCPSYDTKDEYKITYDYRFWYKGLYFSICGTTPDFVYLDCYFPNKYFLLQRKRYREDVRQVFERAYKDGILCYPWNCGYSQILESLTKEQQKRYNIKFDEEAKAVFSEEEYAWLDQLDSKLEEEITEEESKRIYELGKVIWQHLFDKFKRWVGRDKKIKNLFWSHPDLRYLPEVEQIVKDFCYEMLKPMPIRDCDITIKGWQ